MEKRPECHEEAVLIILHMSVKLRDLRLAYGVERLLALHFDNVMKP